MKKFLSVLLVSILMISLLAGCDRGYDLYKDVDLDKYLTLKKTDYIGITVDTRSDEFAEYYDYEFQMDTEEKKLFTELKEGTVQNGDIINLDYSGKVGDEVFEGGTATGQTLEIGSGTFIPGFEEGLIGVNIGETKDVKVTFPESYPNNPDLAGKEAVFTCKVNGITRYQTVDEAYKTMGFATAQAYKDDLTNRAVRSYILNTVCSKAVFNQDPQDSSKNVYPDEYSETMLNAIFEQYVDMYKTTYNQDLEEFLIANGSSVDMYKETLRSQVLPTMMESSMVMYYIFEIEELELTDEVLEKQDVKQETIKECYAVQDIVLDYLYSKAVIKK